MATTLRDEKILDKWSILIAGAQGRDKEVFQGVKQFITEVQAPGIICEIEDVKTGLIKGLLGKKRQFLRTINEALRDHRVYVGARDYGKQLSVSWFLTVEPGWFKKKTSEMITGSDKSFSFAFLDIFDQQDLQDYVTTVHHATLQTVEKLMTGLGQDIDKIDRKSKGFLEIS
jgi:hypothetical protein